MAQAEFLPALRFTPPVISLNFEELEARIDGITEQYKDVIVQEDDVPAIKNEMAGLNKIASNLSEARKEAAKKISEPIRFFEDKVKGLEAKVLSTRSFLDEQVKAHIQRERETKKASVQLIIDYQKDEHGCKGFEIPIQESWLNKTAKDKQITAEVQAIILAHKRQEEERLALEQAKKDRIVAIENHCKALEQVRGYSLPFSRFAHLQGHEKALGEALDEVARIYAEEDKKREPVPPPVPIEKKKEHFLDMPTRNEAPQKAPKIFQKIMTITATYDPSRGVEIQRAYMALKALCLTCSVQIKEVEC